MRWTWTMSIVVGFVILVCTSTITQAQTWSTPMRTTPGDSSSGAFFGAALSTDGSYTVIGSHLADVDGVSDCGKIYIYSTSAQTRALEAILTASNKGAGDYFGISVSISAGRVLVGAPNAAVSGLSQAGSAYVFIKSGFQWSEEAILTASDAQATDNYGCAVALYESFAMIGAKYRDSSNVPDSGAVYVYYRSSTQWTQNMVLVPADPIQDNRFGEAISLQSGTALVGTLVCCWDCYCYKTGLAYVFSQTVAGWGSQGILSASDGQYANHFGITVSIDGDYALVGARYADIDGIADSGAAYVFHRQGGSWSQQAVLVSNTIVSGNLMGISVAIKGSIAIVGSANSWVGNYGDAGQVFTFTRTGSSWQQSAQLTATMVAFGNTFGVYVALSNQYAVISASREDYGNKTDAGAVYFFYNTDYGSATKSQSRSRLQTPTSTAAPSSSIQTVAGTSVSFEASGITTLTNFGSYVYIQDNRILVSAPECITGRVHCQGGGVFVILKQASGQLQQVQTIVYPGIASSTTTFGDCIATYGDWLVISSKNGLYNFVATGSIFVFYWNSVTQKYDKVRGLRARLSQEGLLFGSAVAMNGSYIAVGAPGYNHPITYTNAGAVYFFTIQNNVWIRYPVRVSAPSLNMNEFFGSSIACYSALVAVGNRPADPALQAVYIIQMTGVRQWSVIQTIQSLARDGFGWAVALVGSTLAVSSNKDSSDGNERGSVALFNFDGSQFVESQIISPAHHAEDNIRFGHVISMTTSSLAVGTDTCPTGSSCDAQGRVFVYTLSSSGVWSYYGAYKKGESGGADRFGYTVGISGSSLVVGAPLAQGARGRHGKSFVIDI
eukprot:TRINITY_DN3004_c0_g1_i12.p1 TRINITY_DN3004_c0_g1~~TRINITY_DN3004_c0_g1_i12.p1  ORF type:complete len:837 (+),score=134.06 TRINITY_DN3004_c0_g1_i12:84-2594(+)